jgi:hypothetical protein
MSYEDELREDELIEWWLKRKLAPKDARIAELEKEVRRLKKRLAGARIVTVHPDDEGYNGEPNGQNAYEIEWPAIERMEPEE